MPLMQMQSLRSSPHSPLSFPHPARFDRTSPPLVPRVGFCCRPSPSKALFIPRIDPVACTYPGRGTAPLLGVSSDALDAGNGQDRGFWDWLGVISEALSTAFPVWVALGCLMGLVRPSCFNWVKPQWTVLGLSVTMLGMGMTLSFDDLRGALAMPKELVAGFVLQYSVSSALVYIIVRGIGVIVRVVCNQIWRRSPKTPNLSFPQTAITGRAFALRLYLAC
ncbi:hypothetical protein MLD38_002300 [Melastoma candidum]|uniref:Uncharacterized protein n=1 Tax=Melastoma candidum TaxID=119954 RepID=A0ACB9SGE2_9MYRT|nr:hypothetical protein MLD38_002300 [Melastoma candidum]